MEGGGGKLKDLPPLLKMSSKSSHQGEHRILSEGVFQVNEWVGKPIEYFVTEFSRNGDTPHPPFQIFLLPTFTIIPYRWHPKQLKVVFWDFKWIKKGVKIATFLLAPFYRRGRVYKRKFCLSVCLSVITFSFFEYSMIWWFRPCKPYIFWKLIMLATSTALFWPSNTEYQPVPPSTDQVFNDLMV